MTLYPLLCTQEAERSDLLEQYRKLSQEAEQYQTATHQLESEGSNLRLEVMTKESELRRAHDKIENLEREILEVSEVIFWFGLVWLVGWVFCLFVCLR